jgi:uncharacterized protein
MSASDRRVGTVAWVDLATPDVDAAAGFYARLLGWTTESDETEMGRYVTASVGAGPVGGMMAPGPDDAGAPPAWTVVFRVADAQGAYDHAQRLGATGLQPPMQIPGGALIAAISDPAGAVVALMESREESPLAWGDTGAVAWVETQSRDVEASRTFYEGLLGWSQASDTDGYRVLGHDGGQVAGLMAMPAEVPDQVPSFWLVYFAVDDVSRAVAEVEELGGSVLVPPTSVADMRFAVATDPLGAAFGILENAPPARDG